MSDERRRRAEPPPEPPLADTIELAARRIMTGVMIAGAAIGLGLYSRPGPPRFQALETETGIVRVDTRSGTILHCVENGCYTVVRRGQSLLEDDERQKARLKAFGDEAAPAQKALPAPQPQRALPAPAAQPSPAPVPTPVNAQ
jgi:hypothetical protein